MGQAMAPVTRRPRGLGQKGQGPHGIALSIRRSRVGLRAQSFAHHPAEPGLPLQRGCNECVRCDLGFIHTISGPFYRGPC